MKTALTLIFTLALANLLLPPQASQAEEIARLPMDSLENLGLRLAVDAELKTQGQAALRIETLWATTVCLGQVSDITLENARLLFTARVRTQLQGEAFLEMWCHFGDKAYFSKGLDDPAGGSSEWRQLQTPFILQQGQRPDKITLNLVVNGQGTVWVDDVRLMAAPLQ